MLNQRMNEASVSEVRPGFTVLPTKAKENLQRHACSFSIHSPAFQLQPTFPNISPSCPFGVSIRTNDLLFQQLSSPQASVWQPCPLQPPGCLRRGFPKHRGCSCALQGGLLQQCPLTRSSTPAPCAHRQKLTRLLLHSTLKPRMPTL